MTSSNFAQNFPFFKLIAWNKISNNTYNQKTPNTKNKSEKKPCKNRNPSILLFLKT